tara:strand:+ start:3785 stop:4888 length:1104 start_codon:yes stop_codon:yes gene_type:complete
MDLSKLKKSASIEITSLSKSLRDEGKKVYTLSIGDTHFPPPKSLFLNLHKLPESSTHYSSSQGILKLREEIANYTSDYNASEVVIVPGLKQGFYYLLEALNLKKAVVLEPAWLGYQATCVLAGYDYRGISTYENDWISKLRNSHFEVIMICLPNNPDGSILTLNKIEEIKEIAESKNAWIILDIIYERYSFDTNIQDLISTLKSYSKLVIGNGFSKSHAMTGFRLGYLLIKDQVLLNDTIKIQQNLATCPSTFSQYLLAGDVKPKEIEEFHEYYKENRNTVLQIFPEWDNFIPKGGFYYFVDLSIYGISNADKFCIDVLNKHGIAMVMGSAYGTGFDSFVRISYSIERTQLVEALNKLKLIINNYNE